MWVLICSGKLHERGRLSAACRAFEDDSPSSQQQRLKTDRVCDLRGIAATLAEGNGVKSDLRFASEARMCGPVGSDGRGGVASLLQKISHGGLIRNEDVEMRSA
jgi:hypothetical protein